MAVEAVVADIEFAVGIPLYVKVFLVPTNVFDLGEGFEPVETPGLFRARKLLDSRWKRRTYPYIFQGLDWPLPRNQKERDRISDSVIAGSFLIDSVCLHFRYGFPEKRASGGLPSTYGLTSPWNSFYGLRIIKNRNRESMGRIIGVASAIGAGLFFAFASVADESKPNPVMTAIDYFSPDDLQQQPLELTIENARHSSRVCCWLR